MKKLYTILILFSLLISSYSFGQTINGNCITSLPFCTGITYNYPAATNTGNGEVGPNYGCLYTTPNPAWYYLEIAQGGFISIDIHSDNANDIDFICWGPFTSPTGPCTAQLTGGTNPPSHDVAGPSTDYPSVNIIDCSYSPQSQEWCYIPNAQPGEYYLFLITNYANVPCNIIFNQVSGTGVTSCSPSADISGNFFLDANNDGIRNFSEIGIQGGLVFAPTCGFYTQSDTTGNYNAYICTTPDTIKAFYNHPYTTIQPPFYELSGNTINANFAIQTTPNVYDFATVLTNTTVARPGFAYPCVLTISNEGTEPTCGTVKMIFDSIFNYTSSNPPADIVSGDTLTWNNICIQPFQSENMNVVFSVDTNTALSTPFTITANTNISQTDTNITNNSDLISDIVVGSFDPNDKNVVPEGEITNSAAAAEQELVYTIRFQNTGTYLATNIRIVDTLSNWLQIPSFTLLSSSHPCTYNISQHGIVEFTFNNINLPDESSNEPGSHGFVKFKVNCKPELSNGGNVFNTGHIYFDFNQPIVTNTTLTFTKMNVTNIPATKKTTFKKISLEPNPASEFVNINLNYSGKEILSLEVLDAQGRSIINKQPVLVGQKTIMLNISKLDAGAYMVRISGKDFSDTEPLIIY